jgi:hypothetical protein
MVYCPKCEPRYAAFGWLPILCMRCVSGDDPEALKVVEVIESIPQRFKDRQRYWEDKLNALKDKLNALASIPK